MGARLAHESECRIDGVFLADTAEIDLHTGGQAQMGALPPHPMPADAGQDLGDLVGIGEGVGGAIELPELAQYPGGDIEAPFAKLKTVGGEVE